MQSILPKELHADAPQGFSKAGHLSACPVLRKRPAATAPRRSRLTRCPTPRAVHLNLRPRYLLFKHAIAEIFMSKNSGVRTVVNKIDTINESEFRTFPMEVLAGPAEFEVTMVRSSRAGLSSVDSRAER